MEASPRDARDVPEDGVAGSLQHHLGSAVRIRGGYDGLLDVLVPNWHLLDGP